MIIDFHTHSFPDAMAPKTIQILEDKAGFIAYTNGTILGLVESMKEANVDISLLLPVVTNPKQTLKINNCAIENNGLIIDNKKFYSFGGIHPDDLNYRDELKRLKDNGIKGIKIHPDYQGVYINDERFINIIDEAFSLGLIVVTHAGIDYGFLDDVRATPERIKDMLSKLKHKGKLIIAHMGYTYKWDEVVAEMNGYDVYFDLALSLGDLSIKGIKKPLMDEKTLLEFIKAFGSERILFATDSPWMGQKESVNVLNSFNNVSEKDKENILYKNALRLLNI